MEFNNVNSNGENVVAINLKLSHFSFLEIVKIEFKMKLQSLFLSFELFKVPAKFDFPYLSPHLLEWNKSKLPMFIKI